MKIEKVGDGGNVWQFYCPGCKCYHEIHTKFRNKHHAIWTFNGDENKPTITPSILVFSESQKNKRTTICHSFVRNGKIQYLSDCIHELKGQTIDLPEIE